MAEYDKGGLVKTGYYIANESGDILTSVKNPRHLEWTMQALMEEEHKHAVVYSNPYQIPRSIAAQLKDNYLVFKVDMHHGRAFADYEDTLSAECVGMYAGFKAVVPTAMQSHTRQHDWHERSWQKN